MTCILSNHKIETPEHCLKLSLVLECFFVHVGLLVRWYPFSCVLNYRTWHDIIYRYSQTVKLSSSFNFYFHRLLLYHHNNI